MKTYSQVFEEDI